MNAPLIWVATPAALALLLLLLRRRKRVTVSLGVIWASLLAVAAWQLPIGTATKVGPWSVKIEAAMLIFGRRIELVNADRPLLTMIYLGAAFWLGGVAAARAPRLSIPAGLLVVALLTAAQAVEPFLYAALLIEMAVLVCVPILSSPGQPTSRGSLRFLIFQTFGTPFILLTGYLLAGIEANPGDAVLLRRVSLLMGLGFLFLLAVFPFHSWMPMLAEEAHPYTAAFVLAVLPEMVLLFGLSFLDRYTWMRENAAIFETIRAIGVLMIIAGGFMTAFQRHLGRMLAFTVMAETGLSLLTVSMLRDTSQGLWLHFGLLPPRILALGVWSLSLSLIASRRASLSLSQVQGLVQELPLAALGAALAQLSLAGLPLLGGFPIRWAVWNHLASEAPWAVLWSVIGNMGLFVACFRTMGAFITSPKGEASPASPSRENWFQLLLICLGLGMLLILGLFPQQMMQVLASLPGAYAHLAP